MVGFHPEACRGRPCISQILGGRAVLVRVVFPVLLRTSLSTDSPAAEQVGRDGRIHAAGHADDHLDLAVVSSLAEVTSSF